MGINLSDTVQRIAPDFGREWDQHSPLSRFLKLALFRKLKLELHRFRSTNDAEARSEKLISLNRQVEVLVNASLDQNSWEALLADPHPTPAQEIPMNPRAIKVLGEEKILREDRNWERAILAEGLRSGGLLYRTDQSVPVSKVTSIHLEIEKRIWPEGVILYVETQPEQKEIGKNQEGEALWHGRWILIFSSKASSDLLSPQTLTQIFPVSS